MLFSSLPFLVEFGLARPNREFFFDLQDFPRDAAEMFMNASLTLFFRQAAAQLSPLAPPPCRHGEFAQGAVGRRQTPLCATVLRLWGRELVVSGKRETSRKDHSKLSN